MGREIEVDAISDGENILIPGIMEHLERAGVHSGDSVTMYPSQNISDKIKADVLDYTKKLALAIGITGMINIQFIEFEGELYVIEVNPRASRTVPYISKVSGVPIVDLATQVMLGAKIADLGYGIDVYKKPNSFQLKFQYFQLKNCLMLKYARLKRSTGKFCAMALYKKFGANMVHQKGKILATINKHDKAEFLPIAKDLAAVGYKFIATTGTAELLRSAGIEVEEIRKIDEEEPNILDIVKNREVDLVVNTPTKGNDSKRDGFLIRRQQLKEM
jgi:carbamoyl-phosphate synthase large subunit